MVVERPVVPTSLEISKSEEELKDPHARPVKVRRHLVRTTGTLVADLADLGRPEAPRPAHQRR